MHDAGAVHCRLGSLSVTALELEVAVRMAAANRLNLKCIILSIRLLLI